MITAVVNLFTDPTTGLIPQIVTGVTDVLGPVLLIIGGLMVFYFVIRLLRRAF